MKALPIELSTVRGKWAVSADSASHSLTCSDPRLILPPRQSLVLVRVLVPFLLAVINANFI